MSQGELPAYQPRSRQTREKIVNALGEALKEKPFDQVSVAEIAERAGVAVGSVYQRFKNKDALIPVILEIYEKRIAEWKQGDSRIDIEETDDLRSALRKLMRQSWKIVTREAHLLRAVHLNARLKPELGAGDEWEKYEKASVEGVKSLLLHYEKQIKRKNMNRAVTYAAYFFNSIMIEKGLYPEESPARLCKHRGNAFPDDCADMLYGFLTTPED